MKSFIAVLKRRAEFLRVARAGHKSVTASLVAQIAENAHDAEFRVGFTASRKVGNAVERNRARRRLRAAAKIVMPERALPGHDYVLIARRPILRQPFDAVLDDLGNAVRRLAAPFRKRSRPAERKTGR